jgi:enoyl-CoA hydratase
MTGTDGSIDYSLDGNVGHIVLNRPAKLNAMTVAMDHTMNDLVYRINNDREVRAVIISGAGERAFCVGSDITDLDGYGDNWEYRNRFDARSDYARATWLLRKPLIAAIHGHCIGGGLEVACAADIRIASPDASFAAGEIKWGWHGGSGATQLLTHQLGSGFASKLLLTGDPIDAAEAYRIGLVQELVERDQLLERAKELASTIASRPPIATQRVKYMVRVGQNVPIDSGLLIENDSFSYLMMTDDSREGREAFAEKRQPHYRGR